MKNFKISFIIFNLFVIGSSLNADLSDRAKATYYETKADVKDAYDEAADKTKEVYDDASDRAKATYYDAKVKVKDATQDKE